ncbi:MAG: hypothetical protein ACM3SP_04540 [Chloroflexota bacterium]
MAVHWALISSKIIHALIRAWPRFLWGILGTWGAIGPIVLLLRSGSAGWILTTLLVFLLLFCYAVVLQMYLRSGLTQFRELVSNTGLALCFIIVGGLGNETVGVFESIKVEIAAVYVFTGFFIAELIKPKTPFKALGKMFGELFRK